MKTAFVIRDRIERDEADAMERRRVLFNHIYFMIHEVRIRASLAERRTDADR